jgi:hypothetical protein
MGWCPKLVSDATQHKGEILYWPWKWLYVGSNHYVMMNSFKSPHETTRALRCVRLLIYLSWPRECSGDIWNMTPYGLVRFGGTNSFRRLVAGFLPRRPGFDPRSGYAGCVRVVLGVGFPPPILIPSALPHSSSFIIRGWYSRPNTGRRIKCTQSHPTSRN